LRATADGLECVQCGAAYRRSGHGAFDLRPPRARSVGVEFRLGSDLFAGHPALDFVPLERKAAPAVDFGDTPVPYHMTVELMSHFPKAAGPASLMLDLACGNGVHRRIGECAGFEWVGVDADPGSAASVVADAHALPFEDRSFELVLSVASLHLMRHPHVVLQEVRRVLRPGGAFLGTVAFLEPFHDGGYYHHTHLGILNSLDNAGFRVHRIAPSADWTALRAQAQMALFPRMPAPLAGALVFPVELLHRLWWHAGRALSRNPNASEAARVRNLTAAFAFVASAD
jgi:SAM-dependent methyltransferase